MASTNRPLSPHLQVYKPQLTSVMSILHRATGIALALGTFLLVWWLIAAATGESAFSTVQAFTASWVGRLLLLGWSYALFYHLCNGIRHLIWDTGLLFKIQNAYMAGYIVLGLAALLTLIVWIT